MHATSNLKQMRLRIVGMDCASCSILVHRALEGVKGVRKVGVSYMLDLVLVDYDPEAVRESEIIEIIRRTGYEALPIPL